MWCLRIFPRVQKAEIGQAGIEGQIPKGGVGVIVKIGTDEQVTTLHRRAVCILIVNGWSALLIGMLAEVVTVAVGLQDHCASGVNPTRTVAEIVLSHHPLLDDRLVQREVLLRTSLPHISYTLSSLWH